MWYVAKSIAVGEGSLVRGPALLVLAQCNHGGGSRPLDSIAGPRGGSSGGPFDESGPLGAALGSRRSRAIW